MLVQESHLHRYIELFLHRPDIFAMQKTDGSYFLVHEPITLELLRRHLAGEVTCGWYALRNDNTVRWIALDADQENGLFTLQQIWQRLQLTGIDSCLEESRRGGHLWVFVEPMSATIIRALMKQVLDLLDIAGIEIYPRQDELPTDGVGSLIRGPLGVHQLTSERYFFLDPLTLKPIGISLADQLKYLQSFNVNSASQITEKLTVLDSQVQELKPKRKLHIQVQMPSGSDNKIMRLKAAIGDLYAFVSQYVTLDAKGRGSCPFHPPDRHPSFAVNREKGYWICFHEINPETGRHLGGDAIEFYRRLYGLDFKKAVRKLAEEYGVTHLLN